MINGFGIADNDNDTYQELIVIAGSYVGYLDPRGTLPNYIPAWTNISLSFADEYSGESPVTTYYSWNGGSNQSSPGYIPPSTGVHDLEVWAWDEADNVAYRHYQFYSAINIKLNYPQDGDPAQPGTIVDMTFSKPPLEAYYSWDDDRYWDYVTVLPPLPTGNNLHYLYVKLKDQYWQTR